MYIEQEAVGGTWGKEYDPEDPPELTAAAFKPAAPFVRGHMVHGSLLRGLRVGHFCWCKIADFTLHVHDVSVFETSYCSITC